MLPGGASWKDPYGAHQQCYHRSAHHMVEHPASQCTWEAAHTRHVIGSLELLGPIVVGLELLAQLKLLLIALELRDRA